ncbi:MAG: class I SAM-dependent methyltransferase [Candidatus Coatesbacteria bacterium]|nr:class I SAM-dependent methyltransferase [Candidatus Coatesbacteria bacterium]
MFRQRGGSFVNRPCICALLIAAALCGWFVGCVHRPMLNDNRMSAGQFDEMARTLLAPVYPALAQQILLDYHITFGNCLDVGGGGGYLAIELAQRSGLHVTVLDIDPEAIEIARRNIKEAGLEDRIDTVVADAAKMPLPDSSFELVISRGSLFFWQDKVGGLREVYRVLKPGGIGFVGGGFSRLLPREERSKIVKSLCAQDPNWGKQQMSRLEAAKLLDRAGITNYSLLRDAPPELPCACGLWLEIHKP